jgi:ABC-type sugar transport system permease subunit
MIGLLRNRFDGEARAGLAFVSVPMALFSVFFVFPLAYALYMSVFNYGLDGPDEFVGLGNYTWLLKDPYLHKALWNTLRYTLVVVPVQMALGLSLALIVNQSIPGQKFFRSAFYFPSVTSSAAVTMIALFVLSPGDAGLLNRMLGFVGLPQPNWFGDSSTALPAIMGLNAWTTAGTMMLFYLAALQAIPNDLYEASSLDGASSWKAFWKITFPMLRSGHYFVAMVSIIGCMKVFDQAFIVSNGTGGPNYSTMTIVLYIYRVAFNDVSFGYASAIGVALFALLFSLTIVQKRFFAEEPF